MPQQTHNQGYVLLISVLVVSVIGLAIATSVITLGIGSSQTSLSAQKSVQARALADACAEHALDQLRQSVGYSGNEVINLGQGSCQVLAVGGSGNTNRTVQVTGTVGSTIRKVVVTIASIQPAMQVTEWQEVADF